jgi:hypothetical protein
VKEEVLRSIDEELADVPVEYLRDVVGGNGVE